ncbi:MAG: type II toxin-antitoxin system RelE/ParE family toxin [Planctomycetes bacterium]|nr:type II toxin-antitoxin system RelE/ParE family toxin [Planctomycetota bacterium]
MTSAPLPIVVTSRAAGEIDEASTWWVRNRPAAPGAIHEELTRAFALLAAQSRIGATARNASLPGVRRIHLDRVRYHVYYRVTPAAIEVLAFWHSSRGRGPAL